MLQLRERVRANAVRYEPDLARALNNLAKGLFLAGGRFDEARGGAKEPVITYRKLAANTSAQRDSNLRASAEYFGQRARRAWEHFDDALSAAEESVSIYGRLAIDNPAQHEPNVAQALDTLASVLADVGGVLLKARKQIESQPASTANLSLTSLICTNPNWRWC